MSISEHKHMPEPVRRIEVFTGAGRRRSWSAEEKAAIIAESYSAGEPPKQHLNKGGQADRKMPCCGKG